MIYPFNLQATKREVASDYAVLLKGLGPICAGDCPTLDLFICVRIVISSSLLSHLHSKMTHLVPTPTARDGSRCFDRFLSGNMPTIFKNLPAAPVAEKKPLQITHHGITRHDDYAWMQAKNWPSVLRNPSSLDPKMRSHLEEENAYTEAAMADTHELQNTLLDEMRGRIKRNNSSCQSRMDHLLMGAATSVAQIIPAIFAFRATRSGGRLKG